jgi:hypothetical protein
MERTKKGFARPIAFITTYGLSHCSFFLGMYIYSSGLVENMNRERARKQAAAPKNEVPEL